MTLFSSRIPQEVKLLTKALDLADPIDYKTAFKLALSTYRRNPPANLREKLYAGKSEAEKERLLVIAVGFLAIFRLIFRTTETALKPEAIKLELESLRLPTDVITDMIQVAYGQNRKQIINEIGQGRSGLTSMAEFQWRLDVSISTSSLSRVMEPTIMMKIVLSNGLIKNFEVPMKLFHQLRCYVALVLKEMEDLEKRNVLKMAE